MSIESVEIESDPLDIKAAGEFVQTVMAPVVTEVCENVNTDDQSIPSIVSVSSLSEKENELKSDRKRNRSDDVETETKRMKHNESHEQTQNDAIANILKVVENLALEVKSLNIRVFDRMDSLEKTFAKNVVENMTKVVDGKINKVRKDVGAEIEGVRLKVTEVEKTCMQEIRRVKDNIKDNIKKEVESATQRKKETFANVAAPNVQNNANVVIKNLPERNGEADDTSLTKSSVEGLIRDGLRLRDAKVIKAVRKVNKSSRRPGVVIATLETTQQKEKVMKDKYKLKTNAKYRDVYIENEKSKDDLKADQNLRTIVREMGRHRDYYVVNGQIKRRTRDGSQDRDRAGDDRRRPYSRR